MLSDCDNEGALAKATIGPKDCFDPVLKVLNEFIPIEVKGEWTQQDIHSVIVAMAAEAQSIHSMQQIVTIRPAETTLRYHLAKVAMEELEQINSQLLINELRDLIPTKKPCIIAIDYTDDPYYGKKIPQNESYVVGGQLKKSTNYFYRYATLYLIHNDIKLTLGVLPVEKGVPHITYLEKLLAICTDMGLKIKVVLLDRGFWSGEVLAYLQREKIPHIMPVKKHGKKLKELLKGRKSRSVKYTMGGKHGPVELPIAIKVTYLKGRKKKGEKKRHGKENLGYVVYGLEWGPQKVYSTYQKRFGIEASYRMRNIVRPRTSSRDPTLRYLYALVSLLLKNIWVALCWRYFCAVRRGPRRIVKDKFRFDLFRLLLWRRVDDLLRIRTRILTLRPMG